MANVCRFLAVLLLLLTSGCFGFTYERYKDGVPEPVDGAKKLVPDEATVPEALETLGPPDLVLRVWNRDRFYWTVWDGDYFKFRLTLQYPGSDQLTARDLFILTDGDESLRFARLDFDREGVLREAAFYDNRLGTGGNYGLVDDALVRNYLEDTDRALQVRQQPSDEKSDIKKGKSPPLEEPEGSDDSDDDKDDETDETEEA